jgi:hypothetical protein
MAVVVGPSYEVRLEQWDGFTTATRVQPSNTAACLLSLCRLGGDSNILSKRMGLGDRQPVFKQATNVHFDGFVHVPRDLLVGLACCYASRQIWGVGRVVPICFFNDNQETIHLDCFGPTLSRQRS